MDGWLRRSATEQGGPASKVRALSPSSSIVLWCLWVQLLGQLDGQVAGVEWAGELAHLGQHEANVIGP